jgi:hypothetical protein
MIRYTVWVAGVVIRVKLARVLMWLATATDRPQGACMRLAARLIDAVEDDFKRRPI